MQNLVKTEIPKKIKSKIKKEKKKKIQVLVLKNFLFSIFLDF
jgi:hypothetical protein